MSISIFFRTWWWGRFVGQDAQGNKYYEDKMKNKKRYNKPRRWVVYKRYPEASKIPAQWHGWLHFTIDEPPQERQPYTWEKNHHPNLTGTPYAHKPKGLIDAIIRKDYEPWVPEGRSKK